jgi:CMP-N-acetylneuraminic acid synthetase
VNILGLIPARGGSKGIPRKNIQPLCGKPLIAYVIEKALKSKYINKLVVSTEDKEIAEIAKEYGADVPFMRPSILATDDAPMLPVVKHAVDWLSKNQNYSCEVIVLLQANSPLMKTEDIDRVIKKQRITNADVVYTVSRVEHPPQWLQKINGDIPYFVFDESGIESFDRRQNLEEFFRSTGTVSAIKTDYLLQSYKEEPRLCLPMKGQNSKVVVLDPISSLDIDSWLDLYLAETILEKKITC